MAGYAVAHVDEIDELVDGRCLYRPVRHHFGVTSFGAAAWTAPAAGDLIVSEHDEGDPTADEELFLVLRATPCSSSKAAGWRRRPGLLSSLLRA
jgi:hypothetical protein